MKEHARGLVIGSILLIFALPVFYVGSEGVWYLASGESWFAAGSAYRSVYAPLDWAGDRWPAIYDARESLAGAWLRLDSHPERPVFIRGNPWPGFTLDVF